MLTSMNATVAFASPVRLVNFPPQRRFVFARTDIYACASASSSISAPVSRRSALRAVSLSAAVAVFDVCGSLRACAAAGALDKLVAARAALDAVDAKIDRAKWDGVRTVSTYFWYACTVKSELS